jgi:NAD+ diphosphatase
MVAFEATILDPENARPDGEEIEEIRWFDRDSIIEEIQVGELLLPPKISVARAMIEAW